MPNEPTMTLTLTADETRRLHAFLTGPEPQTAAASTCVCGGHTAAVVVDGTPAPPSAVGPPATVVADATPPTREEFDALVLRVEVLEADAMDRQLAEVDGFAASLPEPLTVAQVNA